MVKESKGRARQPAERKQEASPAFAVTTLAWTITCSMRCNQCEYNHFGACWFFTNYGTKGHLANRCRTPTNQRTEGTATTLGDNACFECKEVGHFRKNCPKLREQGRGRAFVI